MGVRINTNIEAINAQRNLGISASAFAKSAEKLSSGLRINRAADDAAGLSISEKMRGQVKGLNQAVRNSQDGISMIQTAEGALNETHSILQRMRELAVQGANDTLADEDRSTIGDELKELASEIDRIAASTKFNGKALLDGTLTAKLQIGANTDASETVTVAMATKMDSSTLGLTAAINVVTDNTAATGLMTALDAAIETVSSTRSGLGAVQNRLEHTIANLNVASENLAASESRIRDLDIAAEMVSFTKSQILQQAGTAILAQANQSGQGVLSLLR